jgi:ATPase subunit of ABC transporter with duplicated ATPase domains
MSEDDDDTWETNYDKELEQQQQELEQQQQEQQQKTERDKVAAASAAVSAAVSAAAASAGATVKCLQQPANKGKRVLLKEPIKKKHNITQHPNGDPPEDIIEDDDYDTYDLEGYEKQYNQVLRIR